MSTPKPHRSFPGRAQAMLQVLGSMNFAIMLLVVIAIASVIGTILQQNQPYQDYIIKFGPYWHEIYQVLGLYDVYSSYWFILILSFLVITTSTCVYRNGPQMLRSLQRFNENIHRQSLLKMPQHRQWLCQEDREALSQRITHFLHMRGYRTRSKASGEQITIAAMKGSSNRIGYILTHLAIVVICVGGLLDGNLPLKLKQLAGQVRIETRDLSVSDIPAHSRLPADNAGFRASVSIPEGARVNYAFINVAGGYLLQQLPFSIRVNDFRIEHYSSGQPKSFASDVTITDPVHGQTFASTISVNHPLFYRGYAIYQSSFADGGTRLQLQLHHLFDATGSQPLQGIINRQAEVKTGNSLLVIEFDDFRPFNIFPANDTADRQFVDYGPNFTYKLRKEDGSAREYVNYMNPVSLDDRYYFLSGVRETPSAEFQYLYIPVDENHTLARFFRFQSLLYDEERAMQIIEQSMQSSLLAMPEQGREFRQSVINAMRKVLALFRSGGLEAISAYSRERTGNTEEEAGVQAYMQLLQSGLLQLYLAVMQEEGHDLQALDARQKIWFDEAIAALNAMQYYGSPFYLQLQSYDHRQATGLQITRTPGKKYVYTGFTMLIIGVFFLFYIHHQRFWVRLSAGDAGQRLILAGSRARHRRDFAREFSRLANDLQTITARHNQR